MTLIDSIEIRGIHGARNVDLPFRNGHCIMIGPNGTGKSTALQISAYMLGRRWLELSSQPFESISIKFQGNRTAELSREDCEFIKERYIDGSHGYFRYSHEYPFFSKSGYELALDYTKSIEEVSDKLGVSNRAILAFRNEIDESPERRKANDNIQKCINTFDDVKLPPALFLPTYRRIELELKKLFEELPERLNKQIKDRQFRIENDDFLIEVIRFGMEDVQDRLTNFERETRDYARNQFNRMMTSYLKDMAAGKAMSVRELRDIPLDQENIEITLSRIEEGLLSNSEKRDIAKTVIELSQGRIKGNPTFQKSWLAHFFIKLFKVNKELEIRESGVTSLIKSINKYISPKMMVYDIESYHTAVIDEEGREIMLSQLSSGEKQIISMLAEVHFRDENFNILIDEPELSLSVPWQLSFLEDVKRAPKCQQVMAVTHSPFIYDNMLSSSVIEFGYD